ncbi:MAG: DNA cytosine methyltransferase [Gammaproteobacteria bacterium]|nr:DNA cytosine methyltransferase [Gammaproteobacteria bacterium]
MKDSGHSACENRPTAIDLFSGCGGLTLGLKLGGFRVIGAVDIDPLSIETYEANHDDVTVWTADIRDLEPSEIQSTLDLEPGDLDLVAGCPPCQGFSTMRTLNGSLQVEDPRNDLLLEVLRFVDALRPKAVMIENVPGLADDESFQVFCGRMKKAGYCGDQDVLNAAEYGVPQRRKRLIYVAGLRTEIPFAEPVEDKLTVKDAIGDLPKPGQSGDPIHDLSERRTPQVMRLIQRIPQDGGSRTDLPIEDQLECHKRCDGFKDVYGRMAWSEVAPTITSGCFNPSKGRFLHPEEHRAITMREAALLQGFPDSYKFPKATSKSSLAMMIGNALPPPFIAAHAKVIRNTLQLKGVTPSGDWENM